MISMNLEEWRCKIESSNSKANELEGKDDVCRINKPLCLLEFIEGCHKMIDWWYKIESNNQVNELKRNNRRGRLQKIIWGKERKKERQRVKKKKIENEKRKGICNHKIKI